MLEFLGVKHLVLEIPCHDEQYALRYEENPFDA